MHVLALDRHRAALEKQYKAEIAHLKHQAGAPGFALPPPPPPPSLSYKVDTSRPSLRTN